MRKIGLLAYLNIFKKNKKKHKTAKPTIFVISSSFDITMGCHRTPIYSLTVFLFHVIIQRLPFNVMTGGCIRSTLVFWILRWILNASCTVQHGGPAKEFDAERE